MHEYYTETDGPAPKRKKKRNRERIYTRRLVNMVSQQGARGCRFPDDSMLHMPYDGMVFNRGVYIPFECKFQVGGKTYSIAGWRKRQPHQFDALERDYHNGAKALFIVFWKVGGRVQTRALPIHLLPEGRVELSKMRLIESLDDLMAL